MIDSNMTLSLFYAHLKNNYKAKLKLKKLSITLIKEEMFLLLEILILVLVLENCFLSFGVNLD